MHSVAVMMTEWAARGLGGRCGDEGDASGFSTAMIDAQPTELWKHGSQAHGRLLRERKSGAKKCSDYSVTVSPRLRETRYVMAKCGGTNRKDIFQQGRYRRSVPPMDRNGRLRGHVRDGHRLGGDRFLDHALLVSARTLRLHALTERSAR